MRILNSEIGMGFTAKQQILILLSAIAIGWALQHPATKQGFETPPNVDVVISRYKESLDWLDKFPYRIRNLYVYNKSDKPVTCPKSHPNCIVAPLPNVGVCDHTYLYHIIRTYDDPAPMTIFLPASVEAKEYKRDKLKPLFTRAFHGQAAMSGYKLDTPVHVKFKTFALDSWEVSDKQNRTADSYELAKATPRPFGAWYKTYFPDAEVKAVSLTGMFAVTKEMIQANPIDLYHRLVATVDKDTFPEAAHYMERSWATLFQSIPANGFL